LAGVVTSNESAGPPFWTLRKAWGAEGVKGAEEGDEAAGVREGDGGDAVPTGRSSTRQLLTEI